MSIIIRIVLTLTCLAPMSCTRDAPRDNIFDPESSLYNFSGGIKGMITKRYPPYPPLDSVRVELTPENRIAYSDISGKFSFDHLAPGQYQLAFSKDEYQSQAEAIRVESQQTANRSIQLNGRPAIDSVSLITKHIAHWWPIDHEYVLQVDVGVRDPDGGLDIENVTLAVPELEFNTVLDQRSSPSTFTGVYFDSDFLPYVFAELPGMGINLYCADQFGAESEMFQTQVSRIISSSPTTLSPGNQAVVDSFPILRWSGFEIGFTITYSVDIFRLNESGIPQFILGSDELSLTTFQWQSTVALPAALYYWTLSATDSFGNVSVSKEATFIVQ